MFPIRISLLTYNLWTSHRWPERKPALRKFFECYRPDIICLQELCEQTQSTVDAALPDHRHVDDPFPGWTRESNIYWNARLFEIVAFGVENVAITSNPYRGLFWVRLQVIATGQSLFVSTAHFTYQEHPDELRTGQSPRLAQVEETLKVLKRIVSPGEPAFFMGDLNDPVLPTYKLAEAGYLSCFVRLNLVPPPTWPSFPTANIVDWQRLTTQTMDWIVSNQFARPISASAPQFYSGDLSPSDHWPVLALYQLEE